MIAAAPNLKHQAAMSVEYAPASLKSATRLVRGFATWLDHSGICGRNVEIGLVDEYLADRFVHRWPRRGEAFTLREFVGLVSVDGNAAAKQPMAVAPALQVRRKFAVFDSTHKTTAKTEEPDQLYWYDAEGSRHEVKENYPDMRAPVE